MSMKLPNFLNTSQGNFLLNLDDEATSPTDIDILTGSPDLPTQEHSLNRHIRSATSPTNKVQTPIVRSKSSYSIAFVKNNTNLQEVEKS
ncbi:hypothetical protein HK096_000584, partial [Nowakowskiella sp. JEL0078]